jgi:6-phosphogluconolactonase
MDAVMPDSQIDALEEPDDGIVVDASLPPSVIVEHILGRLNPADDRVSTNAMRVPAADVRVATDLNELGERAAEAAAATIRDIVESAGRCSLVLSGGTTPRGLYRRLASRFRDAVPWVDVHVFWSDERCVPHDDVRSNYRMARETLLDHVPCPSGNVHAMPDGTADPARAAREYEAMLREYFADAPPAFDLTILGLGADGHTASLFPGAAALREGTPWVLPVTAAAEPPSRLTLTLPVLTASTRTWFLVSGSNKADAVRRVLTGVADTSSPASASARARSRKPPTLPLPLPASVLIRRARGAVIWWLDREAATQLDSGRTPSRSSTALPLPPVNDDDATD